MNIGEIIKEVEFEPIEIPEPIQDPEPVVPETEKEPVSV